MKTYKARISLGSGRQLVVFIESIETAFWFGKAISDASVNHPTNTNITVESDIYLAHPELCEYPIEIQADSEIDLAWNLVEYIHNIEALENAGVKA